MIREILRDDQWQRIEGLLPGKLGDPGVTAGNNRRFVEAVLWIARTGSPWRDLPDAFGNWNSTWRRFRRWALKGVFEKVFQAMAGDPDFEYVIGDGTLVRVHQHGTGAKGGLKNQAIGRSRGGLTTKILAVVDALGNLVRFTLWPGQRHDNVGVELILQGIDFAALLADKAFDSDALRLNLDQRGALAVIPPKAGRTDQIRCDFVMYRWRHLVENFFCNLKQFRRIATRYDKTDESFAAMIHLASTVLALR